MRDSAYSENCGLFYCKGGLMKKKNMAIFIDGENFPAKKSKQLFAIVNEIGNLDYAKVYGIQKDKCTQAWSQLALGIECLKDIRLCGGPGKNKIDRKIQKDISNEIEVHKNIDIVVIATSDHGYASSVKEMRAKGKKVIILGNRIISNKLKAECNEYYCV